MNDSHASDVSWGMVTAGLLIFWPVGIFMLFSKLSNDKAAIINGSNAARNAAVVLFFLGICWIGSSQISSEISVLLILFGVGAIIGGIYLLKMSNDTKKLGIEFKKYLNIIINGKQRNLTLIAQSAGVSRDIVINKLQRMIELQIFRDAYIDYASDEIVLGEKAEEPEIEYEAFICPHCGANQNIVKGRTNICQYCGSAL